MTQHEIRPIPVAEVRRLRSEWLRPFEPPDALVYFGDDAPDTLHAGAFMDEELIGIATVCRDPLPGQEADDVWRLRGMAIKPEVQGQGHGRALLEHCIAHIRERGGRLLWCNGRVSAAGFYESLGFEVCGPEFEVSGTGPHYPMKRLVNLPAT